MKVLVVDDKDDAREMLVTLIDLLGYPVRDAASGKNALEIAPQFLPDVVICDIGLPDISGYELVAPLRACLPGSAAILALSGYTQTTDRELAKAAGFDAMYAKPLESEKLAAILLAFDKSPMTAKQSAAA